MKIKFNISFLMLLALMLWMIPTQAQDFVLGADNLSITKSEMPSGATDSLYFPTTNPASKQVTIYRTPAKSKVIYEAVLENGNQLGNATWFHRNGRPERIAEVKEINGQLHFDGKFEEWYASGLLRVEGQCRILNDSISIKTGNWVYRFEDGSMERIESYDQQGRKSGVFQTYYPDGRPQVQGAWGVFDSTSVRHGSWKVWDLEGNLINHWIYEKGEKQAQAGGGKP